MTGKEIVLQRGYERLAATINILKAQGELQSHLSTLNNLTQILPRIKSKKRGGWNLTE